MATDNFDLQGWMRENKQGPFAGLNQETFKSSKPKSKTGLNEGLMGMIDLQPVGSLSEDIEEEMMDDKNDEDKDDRWSFGNTYTSKLISPETLKMAVQKRSVWNALKDIAADLKINTTDDIDYKFFIDSPDIESNWRHLTMPERADILKDYAKFLNNSLNEDMDDEDAPEIEDTWNTPSEFDTDDDMDIPGGADTSFDKIQAALVKVQDSMGRLLASFKSGTISKDDYVAKRKTLQSMRDRLEAQLVGSDDDAFEL